MVAHEGDVKQVMVRISKRSLHYTARVLHPIARTCYRPHLPAYAGVGGVNTHHTPYLRQTPNPNLSPRPPTRPLLTLDAFIPPLPPLLPLTLLHPPPTLALPSHPPSSTPFAPPPPIPSRTRRSASASSASAGPSPPPTTSRSPSQRSRRRASRGWASRGASCICR